jgi:CDP-diglyceride synthetase
VGVREGIMILTLSGYLGQPASVLISLIMRVITVAGDVLFYVCGLWLGEKLSVPSRAVP